MSHSAEAWQQNECRLAYLIPDLAWHYRGTGVEVPVVDSCTKLKCLTYRADPFAGAAVHLDSNLAAAIVNNACRFVECLCRAVRQETHWLVHAAVSPIADQSCPDVDVESMSEETLSGKAMEKLGRSHAVCKDLKMY